MHRNKQLILAFLIGLIYPLLCVVFGCLIYFPGPLLLGSISWIFAEFLRLTTVVMTVFGFIPALIILISSLIVVFKSQKYRFKAVLIIILIVTMFSGTLISIFIEGDIKHARLKSSTENAKPLILAIKKYKNDKKVYPKNLSILTPKYISKIPNTGMMAYPEFEYQKLGKIYILKISLKDLLNTDEFIYNPKNENYHPEEYYSSFRLGDWTYYYEND